MARHPNGAGPDALVFGSGTVQWSWGLDGEHDRRQAEARRHELRERNHVDLERAGDDDLLAEQPVALDEAL